MFSLLCVFFILQVAHCQVRVPEVVYAWLDSHVTLACQADTTEEVKQITWEKQERGTSVTVLTYRSDTGPIYHKSYGGTVIFSGDGYKNGSIQISNVTLADAGIFKCVFTTFPSGTIEGRTQLQVMVLPTVRQELTQDVRTSCINMVTECLALLAKPPAVIQWIIHGIHFTSKEEDPVTYSNGTTSKRSQLYIVSTLQLYGREVSCLVYQPTIPFEHQKNITVNVNLTNIQFPPQMVKIEVLKKDKEALQLLCKSEANPRPTYKWTRIHNNRSETLPLTRDQETSATLNLTGEQTDGLYVCEAANDVGVSQGYIYMSLKSSSRTLTGSIISIIFVALLAILFVAYIIIDRLRNGGKKAEDKSERGLCGKRTSNSDEKHQDHEETSMKEIEE
ncbi:nectin-1-like isoform X2 [Eleutherodactylus coqui]|uniref:nectin-1-like isoform X2 n=1 Tax=Eleutherodactylus coqui TaxID=57060 RepID=UPI003461A46A